MTIMAEVGILEGKGGASKHEALALIPIDITRLREFRGTTEDTIWVDAEYKGFEHLANHVDAVVESRLRRNIGEEDQAEKSFHRSNWREINPVRDGSSTSWSLNSSDVSREDFADCREVLAQALQEPNDTAMIGKLRTLREEVSTSADQALADIASIWDRDIPDALRIRIDPLLPRMEVFDSGGFAQRFFHSMLCPESKQGSTGENGSEYVAGIDTKKGDKLIAIRNADNSLRSEQEIIADYDRLIKKGCRYFSVTWIPKTGVDLRNVVYVVEDMIIAHNTAHPDDRIMWVLDAVQYGGRDDPADLYRMMDGTQDVTPEERGLVAMILTTSKGFGNSLPHMSIPMMTDFGREKLDQSIQRISQKEESMQKLAVLARNFGWRSWLQKHPELDQGLRFMQDLRLIDAGRQMQKLSAAGKDVMYGGIALGAQQQYRAMFELCKMKMLDDELPEFGTDTRSGKQFRRKKPSLDLVMEFPGLTEKGVEAALTFCARRNTMFGGPMKSGERVVIRYGLPWQLLAALSKGELSQEAFQEELDGFRRILKASIAFGASVQILHTHDA